MKKLSIGAILLAVLLAVWSEYFVCRGYTPSKDGRYMVGACQCWKCRNQAHEESITLPDGWHSGDFVTYRKVYPHELCMKGGTLVFNGKTDRAPYSENDVFYTHVCDKCSMTSQMLNAHWPQFKREWRDSK